jgi:hypothetical protein
MALRRQRLVRASAALGQSWWSLMEPDEGRKGGPFCAGAQSGALGRGLRGDCDVVSHPAKDATLPVGRTAGRQARWRFGGLAELTKEAADALGVGDHCDELQAAVASFAFEHIHRKRSLWKLGPRSVARRAARCVAVGSCRRDGARPAPRLPQVRCAGTACCGRRGLPA